MGKDTTTVNSETSNRVEATPEEQELNRLMLERERAAHEPLMALQQGNLQLGADAIAGLQTGQSQSPIINRLLQGISPDVIQGFVGDAIEDTRFGLNQVSGDLLDSGQRMELEAGVSGDIRRASEESNLNTLFNLFNVAQGQGAQIQSPILNQSQMLGGQLAGLRSTFGTGSQTTSSMNPFLKSFQTSLGNSLGQGVFGSSSFGSGSGGGEGAAILGGGCWVAAEIFGGWYEPKTCAARKYVNFMAPKWFKKLYIKFGERIAIYISDKPVLKKLLQPLFEYFAKRGA